MKVTRAEWEQVHNLIAHFEVPEEKLKSWSAPTSALAFKKKNMLEYLDRFLYDLEELEREMEFE